MIGRFPWDPFPPGEPDPKGVDPLHALAYRSAVTGADAYRSVRLALRREGGVLRVGNRFVPDGRYREVAFVALGNAANSMALATLSVLDERVTQGFLAGPAPVLPEIPFRGVTMAPGWGGSDASESIVEAVREIAARMRESDLLILLLSPGALRALARPPPGVTTAEFSGFLEASRRAGATGRETGLLARTLAGEGTGGRLLPRDLSADVETLVVERGDGAAYVGGGPTIALRPAERAEARSVLERIGRWADLPRAVREALAPGAGAAAGAGEGARRPVVVAGPPDALRAAADSIFDKGWTARLGALQLRGPPETAAEQFLDRVETTLRAEGPDRDGSAKGLAVLAMLTLDLPEGTDEGPALAELLARANDRLRRREMSVGAFRTGGAVGDPTFPPGAVVGAPADPASPADRRGPRPLAMQTGITDVGVLALALAPRPPASGNG